LPVHGDAIESVLQGFTGAGVDHARLWELARDSQARDS
jgi:hypothetical protein